MKRKNNKGRKIYPRVLSKSRIAKLLGIKPSHLTRVGSCVRND
jgi:hypothetical protein